MNSNYSGMNNYPIQWSEGMLLSPHHFQQNDIYWSRQIHARTKLLQPYYFGVESIEIDQASLNEGTVTIKKLLAVFEDGLIVDYDAEYDQEPLSLVLKGHIDSDTKLLKVYANVPVRTEGAASQKNTRRYCSIEGGIVVDENTGREQVSISRLKPVLTLSLEQLHDIYTTLPLLEVEVNFDGSYRISRYIPPMLKISSFSNMKGTCIQSRLTLLLQDIRSKANQLAGISTGKDAGYVSQLSEQHAFIIRQLVSGLPQLEVLSLSGVAHPFDVFQQLAALSGKLCSIGNNVVPPLLPKYNHEDMWEGFDKVFGFAEDIVGSVSLAYSSMVLLEEDNGTFSIVMEQSWLTRTLLLELTFANGQREDQLANWVDHARIGSDPVMKVLADRRMPGATLRRIERDYKLGLGRKNNSVLYTLQNATVETDAGPTEIISPGQKLYLKGLPGKSVPLSVVLHIGKEAN